MISRYDQVVDGIKDAQNKFSLNSSEGRQIIGLTLLSQISETFAMFLDVYAVSHGLALGFPDKKGRNRAPLGKPVERTDAPLNRPAEKQDDNDRIPDSEIPFCE